MSSDYAIGAGATAEISAGERLAVDGRSLARGLVVFATYGGLYLITLIDALVPLPLWANLLFSVGNGLMIAMLFIVGHDCAHGAFVPGRRWNRWLGRIAFVACAHAQSLWRYTHNRLHHNHTNLKGVDPVWAPMSVLEYRAASPVRRWLERVYRGLAGPLVYYFARFWPFTVLLPTAKELRGQRMRHLPDSALALAGLALTIGSVLWLGHMLTPERPLWLVLLLGWVLPFTVWNYFGTVSFYLNHTHPELPWFDDEALWRAHGDALHTTIHMRIPINVLPLYAATMAHTAHHANPSTPAYALEAAQERLETREGPAARAYTLSVAEYRRIVRICKLFDFEAMCWTDFTGTPTTPRLIP